MEWVIYLLKVSACTTLFFALYYFFLQKLTFFSFNRFYLLITLLISFAIPAMELQIERIKLIEKVSGPVVWRPFNDQTNTQISSHKEVRSSVITSPAALRKYNWGSLIFIGYLIVLITIILVSLIRLGYLLVCTRKIYKRVGHLKIIYKPYGFTNCSFLNYVFVSDQNLTDAKMAVLLRHEGLHALKYHSLDKLFITGCKAILWFNPFIYLYDNLLEEVHEYEVDNETALVIGNTSYASLLLEMAVKDKQFNLVHSFVKNPLKERIQMLFTNPSKNMKKLMYLLALPIGLGLFWLFAVQIVYATQKKHATHKVNVDNKLPFILILDPGNGAFNWGAEKGSYNEKDLTFAIADKIKAIAELSGMKVLTTGNNGVKEQYFEVKCFVFLSLHVKSSDDSLKNGINIVHMDGAPLKSDLSYFLSKNLKHLNGIYINDKPGYTQSFNTPKSANSTHVVLNMGFITNKNDRDFITNGQKQDELAKAIVESLLQYKNKY